MLAQQSLRRTKWQKQRKNYVVHFFGEHQKLSFFGTVSCGTAMLGVFFSIQDVMRYLDQPEKIGSGIAVAFVSIFYGSLSQLFALGLGHAHASAMGQSNHFVAARKKLKSNTPFWWIFSQTIMGLFVLFLVLFALKDGVCPEEVVVASKKATPDVCVDQEHVTATCLEFLRRIGDKSFEARMKSSGVVSKNPKSAPAGYIEGLKDGLGIAVDMLGRHLKNDFDFREMAGPAEIERWNQCRRLIDEGRLVESEGEKKEDRKDRGNS
jgi:hypothetical protein